MRTSWIISPRNDRVTNFVPGTIFGIDNSWPEADVDGAAPPPFLTPSVVTSGSRMWESEGLFGLKPAGPSNTQRRLSTRRGRHS